MTTRERTLAKLRAYHIAIKAAGLCYTCRQNPRSTAINMKGRQALQCDSCRVKRAEKYRLKGKPQHLANKLKAFAAYGSVCSCCGETDPMCLAIDHINGGGNAHKREIGHGIDGIYSWLIKHNFPSGFQVLCHTCNQAKQLNGNVCPHQTQVRTFLLNTVKWAA